MPAVPVDAAAGAVSPGMMEADMMVPMIAVIVCILLGSIALLMKKKQPSVLPMDDFQKFPLIKKESLSHDTVRFTFGLPEGHVLGLPIGQHMSLKFMETQDDGSKKAVQRSYTPTSLEHDVGFVTFVIKVYKAGVHPKFPDGGKMSQHLNSLKIGDHILMKGPKGHMTYISQGNFTVKPLGKPLQSRSCDTIGMMAGGTGITPMLQILHAIFNNPSDTKTKIKLLYANQTEDDILVREELETLQSKYPDRFSLHYTLDRPSDGWKYSTGFINKDMVKDHVAFGGKNQQFFCCGPPPMIKFACIPAMQELGYTDKDWVVF